MWNRGWLKRWTYWGALTGSLVVSGALHAAQPLGSSSAELPGINVAALFGSGGSGFGPMSMMGATPLFQAPSMMPIEALTAQTPDRQVGEWFTRGLGPWNPSADHPAVTQRWMPQAPVIQWAYPDAMIRNYENAMKALSDRAAL